MTGRDWMVVGQIISFVLGSIVVFVVWAAFAFACDQGECEGGVLPYTAFFVWIVLTVGVIVLGARNNATPERFALKVVAFGATVVVCQILMNRLLT